MGEQLLPSWREGATRSAILSFLEQAESLPRAQRVAVFDNDGTLWCEKPMYPQLHFFVHELGRAVGERPELGQRPEYRAILDQDQAALGELGLERVGTALLELFEGCEPEEFDDLARAFFADVMHPDKGVPYEELRYEPMLELVNELRARDFDVYLVSAGGAEFVRVISDAFYGVSPEGVVGSQVGYELLRENGRPKLARTTELFGGPNEGPAKPSNIQRLLGRRPVLAGGNSAGDAEMLEYAMAFDGPSLALLVNHDDPEREYAYESVAGTFATDESITDQAVRLGWTVVSMRNDWSTVFPGS